VSGDTLAVVVELDVGEAPSQVSLADADAIVARAHEVGITAIRLVDRVGEQVSADPTVVAAYLAGRYGDIGWVVDAPTTHNAPYNLARRILSLDRATGGRAGVVLRAGAGDEVSDAAAPDPEATDPAERWVEYAHVLTRLWESFPAAALLGDQENAVVADDALIRPIDFDGRFYRVSGPLDGPSSVQGRPVLIAAEPADIGWARVAAIADAVVVEHGQIDAAAAELEAALRVTGRNRGEVALLARVDGTWAIPELHAWSTAHGVDGIVVAVEGAAPEVLGALGTLTSKESPRWSGTLRDGLAVRTPRGVLA
jgi:alkanesulfonate monooxygenase SsuD/methylene tetrahydromethanopterin reductase-like flavin-dependent oxidoreductase (luciferase family)